MHNTTLKYLQSVLKSKHDKCIERKNTLHKQQILSKSKKKSKIK